MKYPLIVLGQGKDRSVKRRHPWIFSGAIAQKPDTLSPGDLVEVADAQNKVVGTGFYSSGSIAVRLLTFESTEINSAFWQQRIEKAFITRQKIGLVDSRHTNIYRLVHAEGDGLSGLIVDVYDRVAVFQAHHIGMHQHRVEIAKAIQSVLGQRITAVYDKSSETLPFDAGVENGYIIGTADNNCSPKENGLEFNIDWESGQKTGFFIDQRENRKLLGEFSSGKKVLNTFSYTGGFSVYALSAGADLVHSVDSSASAIAGCDENISKLGSVSGKHESIVADAMQFMKSLETDYDVIILDPPAFAKHLKARHRAVQAYKRLNAQAIKQIKPGGILFTFSCSQVVDKALFNHTIAAAAIECNRSVKVLHQLHQPADHPVNIFHPESEYLKGLVLQIE